MIRTCKVCQETKEIELFPSCDYKKEYDGVIIIKKSRLHTCRVCNKIKRKEYQRNYYLNHKHGALKVVQHKVQEESEEELASEFLDSEELIEDV